ncbi:hypothetical protein AAW14_21880 [Streptomyces hygroscopicus]|uniref:TOMM precursor leader peptide-binding protein n=1 Tax=Streptomyces hygroscopicus TaxID=1912 RepID=UPI002240DD46|nr:TOMM precursor leader peptide-binding protein [Streptomyces hygroscopicus]MCW7944585.1 hypothetical protein [Streptomyces hygroscopicus]
MLAGPRKFVLKADDRQWESLRYVLAELVPKLRRSVPLREQVSRVEIERLAPYLKQLTSMGVLLRPCGGIDTDADLRLYSFVARRSAEPDEVFGRVKNKRIEIEGNGRMPAALADALSAQGLAVGERGGPEPALTVVVSHEDEAALGAANRRLCGRRRPWLPVLVTPRRVRLGPWTMPGESACPRCLAPGSAGSGGAREQRAAQESWFTLQPGFVAWAGGVVAHMALRAFVPFGAEHPWGRITTIDAGTCEQTSLRAWRDPYCEVCAEHAPTAQEWVEV